MSDITATLVQGQGWGPTIKVTIATSEAAQKAAAAFFKRTTAYVVGQPYAVLGAIHDPAGAIDGDLYNVFFPTCEHGMSLELCSGPQHYWMDDEERQHYGY